MGMIRDAVLILNDSEIYEGFKAYCLSTNSNLISVLDKFNLISPKEITFLPSKSLGKGA